MSILKNIGFKVIAAFTCAHLVEVLGREESTLELFLKPFYWVDVISGSVVAFILLVYVSTIVNWLDKRYDWVRQTAVRLTYQVSLGVIISSLLAFVLVNLQFSFILDQQMEDTTWFYYEFPFVVMLIVMINIGYVLDHFVRRTVVSSAATHDVITNAVSPDVKHVKQVLHVSKGHSTVPIAVEQVAYIFKKDDCICVRIFDGDVFIINTTLDEMEQQLDQTAFFRANRQYIINIKACCSFASDSFGKIKLQLQPASGDEVIVSQKRAPVFKRWIDR